MINNSAAGVVNPKDTLFMIFFIKTNLVLIKMEVKAPSARPGDCKGSNQYVENFKKVVLKLLSF